MSKSTAPKIVNRKHEARAEIERKQRRLLLIGAIVTISISILVIVFGVLNVNVFEKMRPVARVGSTNLTVNQFVEEARFYRWQLIGQYQNTYQIYQMFGEDPNFAASFQQNLVQIQTQLDNTSSVGTAVLQKMVEDQLVADKAKELGISVSADEVEAYLKNGFGFFPDGTPTPTVVPTTAPTSTLSPLQLTLSAPTATAQPSPTATLDPAAAVEPTAEPTVEAPTPTADPNATATPVPTAEPTATPYTFEGYQTEVANYTKTLAESNVSETFFREFIRKQILREKVMEAFTADQPAAEEKVWAHHFLVQDETEAKLISERLKSGVEWNVIAAEIAQDPTGEKRMEDLGWFARGAMVKEFEDAAFSLEVGAISDPVKSSFGYHIIQVLGHEDRPLSAAEWMSARQEAFQTWLNEQRESDLVEEFDRWMDYVPVEPTLPAEIRVPLS